MFIFKGFLKTFRSSLMMAAKINLGGVNLCGHCVHLIGYDLAGFLILIISSEQLALSGLNQTV